MQLRNLTRLTKALDRETGESINGAWLRGYVAGIEDASRQDDHVKNAIPDPGSTESGPETTDTGRTRGSSPSPS